MEPQPTSSNAESDRPGKFIIELSANGTSHFYAPLPGYAPGPATNGPAPAHAHYHLGPPPGQPQPVPVSHSPHPPSPPNNYHRDERSQRQHIKLLRKLEKQRELNAAMSPTHSPSPRRHDANGHHHVNHVAGQTNPAIGQQMQHQLVNNNGSHHYATNHHQSSRRTAQRNGSHNPAAGTNHTRCGSSIGGASSVGTSEDGEDTSSLAEDEEDYQALVKEHLSTIERPEVVDITPRSAKIFWLSPTLTDAVLINVSELRYNVLLSDSGKKEEKYKSLYKGEAYECIVQDLQPGQEYHVRLAVHYRKLYGDASEPTEFRTPACEPDQPQPPKLVARTKNTLKLSWSGTAMNGAHLQHYLLEYDEGKGCASFVELAKTKGKHYLLSKLQPTTVYSFRLAAINEVGPSLYSNVVSYSTSGNPPTVPKPPTLQAWSSSSLRLVWERRAQDGDFLLQLQDPQSGHGFLNLYHGPETAYECCQLRRATNYLFRLRSENEAGTSPWSHEVNYKTLPERPDRPGKPHVKGKIHGTYFRARWDPPHDTGGAEILRYSLEINSGPKFERIYVGPEPEATCDRLQPGTTYQLRASCEGLAGGSGYSEIAHVTTEAVAPAAPPAPYNDGPPTPYAALIRINKPDYNGGAPVLEFETQLRCVTTAGKEEAPPQLVYRGKQDFCVVQQLQPGAVYELQARAINRIGAGSWSDWLRFTAAAAAPSVPDAPKVHVKSATHLHVSWQAPATLNGAPITAYRLESAAIKAGEPEDEPKDFHSVYQGGQTSAELRNLTPFTRYCFRLLASNVAGSSPFSALAKAQTPAAVPAATHILGYDIMATSVTLKWNTPAANGAEVTGYTIEYADRVLSTPDASTEYKVTGLRPETSYKFRLQAINAVGGGAFSSYAKVTTLPSPPAPPALECSGAGHNFIKLKWREVATSGRPLDFVKYHVEMYVTRAKQFQAVYAGTNCMCKVNKLQERTAYTFRVFAHTERAGDGDYSAEYVFETGAALPAPVKAPRVAQEGGICLLTPDAPGAPAALALGGLQLGVQLALEWQPSRNTPALNDRTEYEVQVAVGGNAEYRPIYRGAETKHTIESLAAGTCYQFRVCPVRVTSAGELLHGQPSAALRYQAPPLPAIDDVDGSVAASLLAAAASKTLMHAGSGPGSASVQRTGRQICTNAAAGGSLLQQRSVSASAITGKSLSFNAANSLAFGLIPLGGELSANFAACNDPLHHHHHHHHHHHQHQQPCVELLSATATASSTTTSNNNLNGTTTTATLLAATAQAHLLHHNHHLHHLHHGHGHLGQHQHHQHQHQTAGGLLSLHGPDGLVRRAGRKLNAIYAYRTRLTDQQKAILFMLTFLFFTFLFATIVKHFIS